MNKHTNGWTERWKLYTPWHKWFSTKYECNGSCVQNAVGVTPKLEQYEYVPPKSHPFFGLGRSWRPHAFSMSRYKKTSLFKNICFFAIISAKIPSVSVRGRSESPPFLNPWRHIYTTFICEYPLPPPQPRVHSKWHSSINFQLKESTKVVAATNVRTIISLGLKSYQLLASSKTTAWSVPTSNKICRSPYNTSTNTYCNNPKFSDRYAWANSADPDQTAPRGAPRGAVWSGSTLFAIPCASFGLITLWQSHIVQSLEWLQQIFRVSEYLGNLRYASWHALLDWHGSRHIKEWSVNKRKCKNGYQFFWWPRLCSSILKTVFSDHDAGI